MTQARFAHSGICVANLDRACTWYATYFGCVETKRFDKAALEIKGAVLALGDVILEVLEPYHPAPADSAKPDLVGNLRTLGSNHIALNVCDVSAQYSKMKTDGVVLISELIEERYFFCKDPDGTLLEIRQV